MAGRGYAWAVSWAFISCITYSLANSCTEQFALTEAYYVTVRLLQEFEKMEPRDKEPWMEAYTLVVCSKNGTMVSLKPVGEEQQNGQV